MRNLPRLGILASGSGSNMAAIADRIDKGELAAEIALVVYNNPDAYVKTRCMERGIPHTLLDHRQFPQRDIFDTKIADIFQAERVDLIVMAGWMRIVTAVLIDRFPGQILNIHPSLLPSFPGHKAIDQALAYGVKVTGCTVHIVTLEVDRGPILAQKAVPIFPTDDRQSLQARIQIAEHEIYPPTIGAYLQEIP